MFVILVVVVVFTGLHIHRNSSNQIYFKYEYLAHIHPNKVVSNNSFLKALRSKEADRVSAPSTPAGIRLANPTFPFTPRQPNRGWSQRLAAGSVTLTLQNLTPETRPQAAAAVANGPTLSSCHLAYSGTENNVRDKQKKGRRDKDKGASLRHC